MKAQYAILATIAAMLIFSGTATAFDFGVFPGRYYCSGGWTYHTSIELQNNMTHPLNVTVFIKMPTNTDDNYTAIDNVDWISLDANSTVHQINVTIPGKDNNSSRYNTIHIPIYIDIPRAKENAEKNWEIDIISRINDDSDGGVAIRQQLLQRILIKTPSYSQQWPQWLPYGILLSTLSIFGVGYLTFRYLRKRQR